MKLLAALVLLLLRSSFLEAQTTSDKAPKQPPQATLTAHVDKAVYEGGEHIQVTLTLRAGPRGAYVSKWSKVSPNDKQDSDVGRVLSNVSGFDISLLTLDGKNAETIGHGGSACGRSGPDLSLSERFENEFLFLKPGEEETWRGSIEGTRVKSGKYQVVGVYMPAYDQVHELVGLPEAQGLLVADVVESTPVIITINEEFVSGRLYTSSELLNRR